MFVYPLYTSFRAITKDINLHLFVLEHLDILIDHQNFVSFMNFNQDHMF